MLNDEQFTEEVRTGLRRATDGIAPAGELLTELGHRHGRRVRRARLAVTGAAAIAIVAVTMLTATVAGGSRPPRPETPPAAPTGGQPTGQDAEQILERARSAVARSDEMIIHVKADRLTVTDQMRPDGEAWVFGSAGRARTLAYYGDDRVDADVVTVRRPDGTTDSESVVYDTREVVTMESPTPQASLFDQVVPPGVAHPRDLFSRDGLTSTGRSETVRGRTAFLLTSGGPRPWEIWVDAQTYLPVHVTTPEMEVDYDVLPANQENLALLEHEVPSDFTRRSAPA
jgi:hypothetical protein